MSAAFVMGLGASSLATVEDAAALCDAVLEEAGVTRADLQAIATLDRRADHPALLALGQALGLPLTGISPKRLRDEEARLETPSGTVAARTGLAGIAEAAALSLAGPDARLVVPKRARGGVTAALAERAS